MRRVAYTSQEGRRQEAGVHHDVIGGRAHQAPQDVFDVLALGVRSGSDLRRQRREGLRDGIGPVGRRQALARLTGAPRGAVINNA